MTASAENEEFAEALASATELTTNLDEYETELAAVEQGKKDYEAAKATVEPRLNSQAQSTFKKLEDRQAKIKAGQEKMTAFAENEEFAEALASATELTTNLDEYETELA